MTFEGPMRQAETARGELSQVAGSTQAWSDKQRHEFDSQRMKPLAEAGARLTAALQKAEEQCQATLKLLAD